MKENYPLSEKIPERLRTPSGLPLTAITLDAVVAGQVRMEDLRVSPEVLGMQARIAEECHRPQLAEGLRRAAELTRVPELFILDVYRALRPGRADRATLLRLADELEQRYDAPHCAALLREAAEL
jgi:propanediol dehydratase small subunit